MTINQLTMHNIAPRGITATCVPTSICFATGSSYYDVEEILVREQPSVYRPDLKGNGGVVTEKLFGEQRRMLGHIFTRVRLGTENVHDFKRIRPNGTFLVCIPKHMFVIRDGQVFDLNTPKLNDYVRYAWKVEKV